MEFKEGDRVCLILSDTWLQPVRGWAERERAATVLNAYRPHDSTKEYARIRFDNTRAKGPAGEWHFPLSQLRPLPPRPQ